MEENVSAAVVEPVGRKANLSLKRRKGGGVRQAGYTKSRVVILSIILVRTGVMEIVLSCGLADFADWTDGG